MTAAINIYLKQIALRGAIPFEIALPNAPSSINTDIKHSLEKRLSEQASKDMTDIYLGVF